MMVKLINPRGRQLVVDDKEEDISQLLRQGFTLAPEGVEAQKKYNPVFDKGKLHQNYVVDNRPTKAGISGDVLKVIRV